MDTHIPTSETVPAPEAVPAPDAVPETMDGSSLDIAADKLRQMRQLFPEVFAEGQVDFAKLKAVLGSHPAAPGEERYGLSWPGKHDAFREIQKQTTATLVPERAGSVEFDTTGNVFIEGENLEVLRVLQKSYYGKVKMIYIDPPYNTGNDSFVYPDDFAERREQYEQRAGVRDDEGYLYKQDMWRKNAKENGHFHSVWLSMMYPRLYLARNLLREDGVIFVSIDDNEVANLRLLMDEIFGEENFMASVIWQKKYAVSNDDTGISPMHDYILVYQKSASFTRNLLPRTDKQLKRYSNPDNDPRGDWSSDNYVSNKSKTERPTLYYPIIHPKTGKEIYPDENAVWRYSKDKHSLMERENRLYWGTNYSYRIPRLKRFISEIQDGLVPNTLWLFQEVGHNDEAQKETFQLIGRKVFSTPKPIRLLKRILQISSKSKEHDLILDFFSGSGSLAHAVMELNKEDGGNRKFICVQMPETTEESSEAYRAGYRTIADIARARIRKVSEKLRAEQEGTFDFGDTTQDTGFRSYKLAYSNFKQWRGDVSGAELTAQIEMFVDATQPGTEEQNMLTELLLKAGLPLTAPVETVQAGEHTFYYMRDYELAVVFEAITPDVVAAIRERKPTQVLCLDHLFRDNDQFLSNTRLQLREDGIVLTVI